MVLAATQTLAMEPIRLRRGVDLYVRVNDLSGKRAAMEGKVAGASLMLAIRLQRGGFYPIPLTATDAKGFDHHLVVPSETDLTLIASSRTFDLTDENGRDVDRQTGIARTFRIPANRPQHREVINIK